MKFVVAVAVVLLLGILVIVPILSGPLRFDSLVLVLLFFFFLPLLEIFFFFFFFSFFFFLSFSFFFFYLLLLFIIIRSLTESEGNPSLYNWILILSQL